MRPPETLPGTSTVLTTTPLADARHCVLYLEVFHHVTAAVLLVHADGLVTVTAPGHPTYRFYPGAFRGAGGGINVHA